MQNFKYPTGLKIKDKNLKLSLDNIIQAVSIFWIIPLHPHYTNHGIDHSKRIILLMGELLKGKRNPLNDAEKFILLAGIFLHDIGMQSPKFSRESEKTDYTHQELEDIRDVHHETSAKMILKSIKDPNLNLGFNNSYSKNFAPYIATVSKYHRELDLNDLEDIHEGGRVIKMQLLAALLRIADELDVDYRRIVMKHLQIKDIPLKSKFHWWCHHFVQSLLIDKGRITIFFRFPYKRENQREILESLSEITIKKIQKSLNAVYEILDRYEIRLYKDIKKDTHFKPDGVLVPIPKELLEYLLEKAGIKKEIYSLLPNKLADVVLDEFILGNIFNLEFDVNINVGDTQVEISMKAENPNKTILFKRLGERPTRKQLEIVDKAKKKLEKDNIIIPIKRSKKNSNQEYEIFYNDDESVEKLREILRSGYN